MIDLICDAGHYIPTLAPAPYCAVGSIIECSGTVVAPVVGWADTAAARARGLLGRSEAIDYGAFVLCGAKQVHTFGMDRSIDVALCDRDWCVLHVARMRPNRLGRPKLKAYYAIETRPGELDCLRPGDKLTLRDL